MKKFLIVLLHLIGFPALLGVVVWQSIPVIENGGSYGIMAYLGIILTAALALIYFIIVIIMACRKKMSVYRQTFVSIIVSAVFLCGLWVAIDLYVPDFLAGATSSTIYYEDVTEEYINRVETQKYLLDEFIKRNVACGNLTKMTEEEYLAEGYANAEVQELAATQFADIDAGYQSFFPAPWINMANDSRLTIPVLVHLLFEERLDDDGEPVDWCILDMQGTPMEIGVGELPTMITALIESAQEPFLKPLFESVSVFIADPEVVGSPIFISLKTTDGLTIVLTPSNESRGVLDYQSMAWFNSNGLLIAVAGVMGLRKFFLIWAPILIVGLYAIGLLRKKKPSDEESEADSGKKTGNGGGFDPNANRYANPQFKLQQNEIMRYSQGPSSYVVMSGNAQPNYGAMSAQLMVDRQNNVASKYRDSDFR